MFTSKLPFFGIFLALLLAGCHAPMATKIEATPKQIAKYDELSALDMVAALEKHVNDAKNDNMSFLSPSYYRDAAQVLSKSQSALGNKSKQELAQYVAHGDAILEKGRAVMDIVNYRFSKELKQKKRLRELHSQKWLKKEYDKLIGELFKLIGKVEREQGVNIDKDKASLLKAMHDLEVKTVLKGALHESEAINADSKINKADRQAPITFGEAQRVYKEAKEKISSSHLDTALVQRLGEQALFAARHAQQINLRVAVLQKLFHISAGHSATISSNLLREVLGNLVGVKPADKKHPMADKKVSLEQLVLKEEKRLHDLATMMGMKDLRDQTLGNQEIEMKRVAAELAHYAKNGAGESSVDKLKKRLQAATQEKVQALAQLAHKVQQAEEQATLLVEKDVRIDGLIKRVAQLEKKKSRR